MQKVRSIFLSDIHLGTRGCRAERLLDFLKHYEAERLYLVGDIIDFWAMARRGVYWSRAQDTLLQKILKRARHDTEVIFVPGNHDGRCANTAAPRSATSASSTNTFTSQPMAGAISSSMETSSTC